MINFTFKISEEQGRKLMEVSARKTLEEGKRVSQGEVLRGLIEGMSVGLLDGEGYRKVGAAMGRCKAALKELGEVEKAKDSEQASNTAAPVPPKPVATPEAAIAAQREEKPMFLKKGGKLL